MITLEATAREAHKRTGQARKTGFFPAVFYGGKTTSTPIFIKMGEFKKALKTAGESTIVELKTPTGVLNALIHDVQFDALTDEPTHADFYVVEADKVIEVEIPLHFVGVSPAVKNLGAMLVKVMHELPVECLPKDLPHAIEVDISSLSELDSNIKVGQLILPKGVTSTAQVGDMVVLVTAAKEEVEEKPAEALDISQIEVEKKGKKEEEGEAVAEAK